MIDQALLCERIADRLNNATFDLAAIGQWVNDPSAIMGCNDTLKPHPAGQHINLNLDKLCAAGDDCCLIRIWPATAGPDDHNIAEIQKQIAKSALLLEPGIDNSITQLKCLLWALKHLSSHIKHLITCITCSRANRRGHRRHGHAAAADRRILP